MHVYGEGKLQSQHATVYVCTLNTIHFDLFPVTVLDRGVVLLHKDSLDELDGEGGLADTSAA